MSLETQIADLVKAGSDLVATFAGKKAAIDAAVNAALQAIPNNARTLYVDSVAGSDAADGTSLVTALKSIKKAIEQVPVGGSAIIYLKADGTYPIDTVVPVVNKVIRFDSVGDGAKPVIAPGAWLYQGQNCSYGLLLNGSAVSIVRARLKLPALADDALPVSTRDGFICRDDLANFADCTFVLCDIELNRMHLARVEFGVGFLRMGTYACAITRVHTDGRLLKMGAGVASLGVSSLTLPAGTSLGDLIAGVVRDANNTPRNLASNVVL